MTPASSRPAIRALIVDDEPPARRRVRMMLDAEGDVEVVGECRDGREAIAAIAAHRPDLVLLDVQMPEVDGFDVVAAVGPERMPAVVFVTAYDAHALRAFEVHALDYLLKPFDRERLRDAMRHVRRHLSRERRERADAAAPPASENDRRLDERLAALLAELRGGASTYLERIPVKSGGRIRFVTVEELDYIEAEANYVRLHAGGQSYLLRETLRGIEGKLDPRHFLRIHRSRIVRVDRIREMEPLFQGEYLIVLRTGARLTSGRSYRGKVQEALKL